MSDVVYVKSLMRDWNWPSLPNPRGCQLLSLLFQFEKSENELPAEILRVSWLLLNQLLAFAENKVPFYRKRLEESADQTRVMATYEDWRRLPLLTRSDVQVSLDDMVYAGAGHGELSTSWTSGSTGVPVKTVGTAVTRLMWHALTLRQHLWANRDFSMKLAAIRLVSEPGDPVYERRYDNWGSATVDVFETGPLVALDIHRPISEQAAWLIKEKPDLLITYPSNALALLEYFQDEGLEIKSIIELRTFGEVLDPRLRPLCKEVWGAKVVDMYSSQEVGHIALQCPNHEHYHVMSENLFVEVIRDDGSWCEPGEVGRVVITTLKNFAMPLIRYECGDYAEVGEPCDCGRGLPVLKRIMGRARNMFVLPDGRKVWPGLQLSQDMEKAEMPPIQQFQVVQKTRSMAELVFVAPRPLSFDEKEILKLWIWDAVGYPLEMTYRQVDHIPTGQNGKYEDFRCEVTQDDR